MLRKTIGVLGIAAITLLATPVAASAAPIDPPDCGVAGENYALPGTVSSDIAVVDPGGAVTVTWDDGYFVPGESVGVVTSGPGAVGSDVAVSGGSASGSGSMWATVTVADDASGSLTVTGTSDCAVGGVTVEVAGDSNSAAVGSAADSDSLAATGSSIPVVLIIAGAGALAFGAILLLARARGRRHFQE